MKINEVCKKYKDKVKDINKIKNTSLKELALIIGAKEEKIILIAKAELIKLEAILTEMKAENYQRQMQGLSIAYDDFSNVIQTADEIAESLIDKSNCKKDINVPHTKDGNEC